MGPTLLIACLWGAVLVYWLWSRRPLGDPVGSFRHELRVLGSATPGRVAPANRLAQAPTVLVSATEKKPIVLNELVGPPVPLTAAARSRNRQELRRRRRDVIAVMALAALVSLFAAVLTGSALLVVLQVLIDLALVTYLYLLARTSGGQAKASRPPLAERGSSVAPQPISTVRFAGASYIRGRTLVDVGWSEPGYGDFGSYADLAMSRGN